MVGLLGRVLARRVRRSGSAIVPSSSSSSSSLTLLSPPFPSPYPQEETHDKDAWGVQDKSAEGAGAGSGGDPDEEEDGLSSGGGRRSSGAAAPAPAASAPPADADDLLGLGGGSSSAPAAVDPLSVPVTRRIGVESPEKVQAWLTALLAKPAGVLYEDSHVQVGVKHKYTGAEGKCVLFIGNKGAVPLVALKVRVPEVPYVTASVGDVPSTLAPKAQAQVTIDLACLTPFSDFPQLQLSFISEPGTGHAYALKVPVSAAQFSEPVAMPGADFRSRWTALAGAPREVTAVIKPASGAGAVAAPAAAKALELIGMAAVDAGAPGATGASWYRTKTVGGNGQPISVGCLAMAIPDAAGTGAFKVAIRSQHPDVSKSLMAVVQGYLGGL